MLSSKTDAHLCEGIQEVSNSLLLVELLHVLPLLWHRRSSFKKKDIDIKISHYVMTYKDHICRQKSTPHYLA